MYCSLRAIWTKLVSTDLLRMYEATDDELDEVVVERLVFEVTSQLDHLEKPSYPCLVEQRQDLPLQLLHPTQLVHQLRQDRPQSPFRLPSLLHRQLLLQLLYRRR